MKFKNLVKQVKQRGDFTIINKQRLIMLCPECCKEMGVKFALPVREIKNQHDMYMCFSKLTLTAPINCPNCNVTLIIHEGNVKTLDKKKIREPGPYDWQR
jgi:hypothetical protein